MGTPFQNLKANKLWRELATLQPENGDRCGCWKGLESTKNPKEVPYGYHILGRGQDPKVARSKPWSPKIMVERTVGLNLWWLKPPYRTQVTNQRSSLSISIWEMLTPMSPVEQRELRVIRISDEQEKSENGLKRRVCGLAKSDSGWEDLYSRQ